MNGKARPSITSDRSIGVIPLCEEFYVEDGKKYEWSTVSESEKIDILKLLIRGSNAKDRALWIAAEELSDFGEGQQEIYTRLAVAGGAIL